MAEEKNNAPPDILTNDKTLEQLLTTEAISWATIHGVIMMDDTERTTTIHAPIGLLPAPIPKTSFDSMVAIAPLFNLLVDRISRDAKFINDTLSSAASSDEFTKNLLNIYNTARNEDGPTQPICLGLNRSDYMLQGSTGVPLQVELNTIAASFGCLSARVTQLHKYLIARHLSEHYKMENLPDNNAIVGLSSAIATAAKLYNKTNKCIVMIIPENERNAPDQRLIEYELWETHRLPMLRRTLAEINENAKLDSDKNLLLEEYNVAVVYFRAGYSPVHYKEERKEWDGLLKLNQSTSILCPSVGYHLAGCKKVQQALSAEGCVEGFMGDDDGKKLRAFFAGLWGLEKNDELTTTVIAKAIASPDDYVVKPQREGGGNNVWGEDLKKFLSSASVKERSAYILMERIKPGNFDAVLLREGKSKAGKCENEIGIYAAYIGDGQKEYLNQQIGHLVRTKFEGTDEGGVCSGFACLNSPLLV